MNSTTRSGIRSTPLGAAAVLTAVTAWSLINVIVKIVQVPAVTFAFYRLWLGSAVMVVATLAARRRLTWRMVWQSLPGGVLFGLNIVLFFSALKHTNVADVLIIQSLQPALTLLVAGRLFGERVTGYEIACTAVSVVGVTLVAIGSSGTPAWSLAGDLFAVGSLLVWTSYFLVSKRVRRDVQALEYLTVVTIIASVVVTPLAAFSGQPLGGLRAEDWMWLALFLLGAQGGHLLVAWAHGQVDVSVSSLLILAEPIISAVAALVVLGEPLTGLEVIGGVLVVGAMAAVVRRATRAGGGVEPEPAPS
jgi:drug/metabolite transporter (DMT)-like permease